MISLAQTAVLLAAAVLAVSLFRLLNLSSILGYVAAGLVIGPWGLRLIHDIGNITKIAEFGVVLLLFIIGLELQPTRLWVMRRLVFGLGAAQVALCTVLLGMAGYLLGLQPVTAAIVGGRLLLRPALRVVARVRVTEVFTAAALLTVIATALLANLAGLSMSLGAFLAGVLLADSEFRHELEADIEPFKGLLLGLFFVAVGMSANLGLLKSEPLTLLALTGGFLLIKIMAVTALGRLAGQRADSARRLGFALPAGGEFAFVLFTLAARELILDAATSDLLILAVTLSMMLGPVLLI